MGRSPLGVSLYRKQIRLMMSTADAGGLARLLPVIRAVVARYDVANARVVGSVARGTSTSASDLDLLVRPGKSFTLIGLQRMQRELMLAVGRRVDVVPEDGVPPAILARMLRDAISL